jgi:formate hydrogenlyase subunit 6/NADH:ubiquinone oxidoreductase subunit I
MYGLGVLNGLWVTLRHFWGSYLYDASDYLRRAKAFPRGIAPKGNATRLEPHLEGLFTLQYPEEKFKMFDRFRGPVVQLRDPEAGGPRCTACGMCEKACPHGVISGIEGEGKGKERRATKYSYHMGRCIFCRLCVEACPFDAIEISHDYELTIYRNDFVLGLEKMLEMGDKSGIKHTGENW